MKRDIYKLNFLKCQCLKEKENQETSVCNKVLKGKLNPNLHSFMAMNPPPHKIKHVISLLKYYDNWAKSDDNTL